MAEVRSTPTLRSYQVEAREFLSARRRAILADVPGLGKSYPTIEAALAVDLPGVRLIVCPKYLISTWQSYLQQYGVKAVALTGLLAQRKQQLYAPLDPFARECRWYIINYEGLREILVEPLKHVSVVILDEAHRLRNRNAQITRRITAAMRPIPYVWCLTGSPFFRDEGDVYTLLRLCEPSRYTSYFKFITTYLKVTTTPWTNIIMGVKDTKEFNELLTPHLLRRGYELLKDVLPEQTVPIALNVAPSRTHSKATAQVLAEYGGVLNAAVIPALRELTAKDANKLRTLTELCEDLSSDSVVIYCWLNSTCQLVLEALKARKPLLVNGRVPMKQREAALRRFRDEPNSVLVANIATLSEGVNLQHCHQVVFYEEDWVSETRTQARARFYRLGQTQPVLEYCIHVSPSIDTIIHNRAEERGVRIADILNDLQRLTGAKVEGVEGVEGA